MGNKALQTPSKQPLDLPRILRILVVNDSLSNYWIQVLLSPKTKIEDQAI